MASASYLLCSYAALLSFIGSAEQLPWHQSKPAAARRRCLYSRLFLPLSSSSLLPLIREGLEKILRMTSSMGRSLLLTRAEDMRASGDKTDISRPRASLCYPSSPTARVARLVSGIGTFSPGERTSRPHLASEYVVGAEGRSALGLKPPP